MEDMAKSTGPSPHGLAAEDISVAIKILADLTSETGNSGYKLKDATSNSDFMNW